MQRMNGSAVSQDRDFLAAEEPLEIRVEGHNIAIVMRTLGEDRELAAGFLVTEGLVHTASDLVEIRHQHHCLFPARDRSGRRMDAHEASPGKEASRTGLEMGRSDGNVINVQLKNPEALDLKKLTRHVFTSSSCGICSKSSIEAVRQQFPPIEDDFEVDPQVLFDLPAALSSAQDTFKRTGGLHACALFDSAGNLLVIREDVGRHNALDIVRQSDWLGPIERLFAVAPTHLAAERPHFIRNDAKGACGRRSHRRCDLGPEQPRSGVCAG